MRARASPSLKCCYKALQPKSRFCDPRRRERLAWDFRILRRRRNADKQNLTLGCQLCHPGQALPFVEGRDNDALFRAPRDQVVGARGAIKVLQIICVYAVVDGLRVAERTALFVSFVHQSLRLTRTLL